MLKDIVVFVYATIEYFIGITFPLEDVLMIQGNGSNSQMTSIKNIQFHLSFYLKTGTEKEGERERKNESP